VLNQDTTKAVSIQKKSNQEKFEDTNMVIRRRKSKDGQISGNYSTDVKFGKKKSNNQRTQPMEHSHQNNKMEI
jgi:hypothetical protein